MLPESMKRWILAIVGTIIAIVVNYTTDYGFEVGLGFVVLAMTYAFFSGGEEVYEYDILKMLSELTVEEKLKRWTPPNVEKNVTHFVPVDVKEGEHGKGLYAREFIPKGTIVSAQNVGNSIVCGTEKQWRDYVAVLDEEAKTYWVTHAFPAQGYVVLHNDLGDMTNHSETPTLGSAGQWPFHCFALKDIQPGEQMTENYNDLFGTEIPAVWWFKCVSDYYHLLPEEERAFFQYLSKFMFGGTGKKAGVHSKEQASAQALLDKDAANK